MFVLDKSLKKLKSEENQLEDVSTYVNWDIYSMDGTLFVSTYNKNCYHSIFSEIYHCLKSNKELKLIINIPPSSLWKEKLKFLEDCYHHFEHSFPNVSLSYGLVGNHEINDPNEQITARKLLPHLKYEIHIKESDSAFELFIYLVCLRYSTEFFTQSNLKENQTLTAAILATAMSYGTSKIYYNTNHVPVLPDDYYEPKKAKFEPLITSFCNLIKEGKLKFGPSLKEFNKSTEQLYMQSTIRQMLVPTKKEKTREA